MCTVVYCIVLRFNTQTCSLILSTVVYCGVIILLQCTKVYFSELRCTRLFRGVLHCTRCTKLYWGVLHCTALQCSVLHCTAVNCSVLYVFCSVLQCTVVYYSLHLTPSSVLVNLCSLFCFAHIMYNGLRILCIIACAYYVELFPHIICKRLHILCVIISSYYVKLFCAHTYYLQDERIFPQQSPRKGTTR